jgi:hypothetical protein
MFTVILRATFLGLEKALMKVVHITTSSGAEELSHRSTKAPGLSRRMLPRER